MSYEAIAVIAIVVTVLIGFVVMMTMMSQLTRELYYRLNAMDQKLDQNQSDLLTKQNLANAEVLQRMEGTNVKLTSIYQELIKRGGL